LKVQTTNLKTTAAVLCLAAGCWLTCEPSAAGPGPAADTAAELSPEHFASLQALIKPRPGGFDEVAWTTSLWEARKKAAAEGKPILLWVGDGQPLGWT
jgi:hypothetical protein